MIPPLLRRLALALLLALALVAGASADPFSVATYADLCKVGTGADGWTLDADYIQTADIQCPAGSNFVPIGRGPPFTGSYDGQGYEIRGLTVHSDIETYCGLFGFISSPANITNIKLVDIDIASSDVQYSYVGGVVGQSQAGTISNCSVSGSMTGNNAVGGLVGITTYQTTTIVGCDVDVSVSGNGEGNVGGLVGENYNGVIYNCSVTGTVTSPGSSLGGLCGSHSSTVPATGCHVTDIVVSGGSYAGGLVGAAHYGNVEDCHVSGTVTGTEYLGGLMGFKNSEFARNCTADVTVTGTEYLGGLIGFGQGGSITNCHATGAVVGSSSSVGGLIGHCGDAVSQCSATGSVTAGERYSSSVVGGFAGIILRTCVIRNCSAHGDVIGTSALAGGFAGQCMGSVNECFSTGNVQSSNGVGGFAGAVYSGSTTNCYSTGDVEATTGPWVGGFAGEIQDLATMCYSTGLVTTQNPGAEYVGGFTGQVWSGGFLTDCFWDVETSGQATSAGGAVGKTTAEMQALATFTDWNIATPAEYTDEVWFIVEGEDYPRLAWEGLPVLPPVAAFSASPTTGTAPLTVQFTDASTNAPTAWAWTFGDGGTSAQQHPSHTYDEPGTYTVTLTATNAGGSDAETKAGHITVTAPVLPPVAAFSAAPTSGTAPLTVQFTDASTNAPTARSWSFGDGRTSTAQSPSHTYSTAGTYTVSLTATNAGGSDTETKAGYITVSAAPPTAPPTAANSPAFPYSQQRKETLSFLLMCWGALAFVGVFCVVIFLLMNGAQRGSGGI